MVFDHIEKVKQQYTDKYVVVDAQRPELARFKDVVGQVRTVNMSGRALVEFTDYHLNIGWYDIDLDYLKVVDKPEPKEKKAAEKKPAAKPAAKKAAPPAGEQKLSPLELARMQGAAKAESADTGKAPAKPAAEKAPAGKMSTSDVLAAARGGAKPAAGPAESKPQQKADKPPAGKMSTADILAAARGDAAKTPAEPPAAEEPPDQVTEESVELEPPAEPTAAAEEQAADGAAPEKVDRSSMSVDDIIAWCRQHDAS